MYISYICIYYISFCTYIEKKTNSREQRQPFHSCHLTDKLPLIVEYITILEMLKCVLKQVIDGI